MPQDHDARLPCLGLRGNLGAECPNPAPVRKEGMSVQQLALMVAGQDSGSIAGHGFTLHGSQKVCRERGLWKSQQLYETGLAA